MGRYSKDPNEQPWDRHAPCIPFIDKVMQSTTFKWSDNAVWETRPPTFVSSMVITGYEHGNSTIIVTMLAEDGYTYRVPMGELYKVLDESSVVKNQIPRHVWRLSKQGSSYVTKLEEIL